MLKVIVSLFILVFAILFIGWVAYVFLLGLAAWFSNNRTLKFPKKAKSKKSTSTPTIVP